GDFIVNGKNRHFNVINPFDGNTNNQISLDLIIVAVKNYHLNSILPILRKCINKETIVLSVLNGIESEIFLEENVPGINILYTVALGMDAVKNANQLTFTTEGKLLIGAKDNNHDNREFMKLKNLFDSVKIKYDFPVDIHRSLWWKWMINIGVNQVSAVTGASYSFFQEDKSIQELMEEAMMETILVAKQEGVNLKEDDITNWYTILKQLGKNGKTSMLQDIENKRKTEVDAFAGRLIKLADKYGIDVPLNKTLYRLIKVKESQNKN
ncbi:MAG: ketopantoate reductase family protein, partial [Spirochaetaceae bacterium]|nr:ketopantoate reductase family protein [Spirochaetaceae bacterium]